MVDETARQEARTALEEFEAYLIPAAPAEISARIVTMLAHFWVGAMPANLQEAIAADWIEQLKEFPAHAINEACRSWLSSETRKPAPAQIRAACEELVEKQQTIRERLQVLAQPARSP